MNARLTKCAHAVFSKLSAAASAIACGVALSTAATAASEVLPQPTPLPPPIPAPVDVPYPAVIHLSVDATDVAHRIIRVHETIPVQKTGDVILLYPQWLPGHHSPGGPLRDFAGLEIKAKGHVLAWRRDPVEMYAFHVDVGANTRELDITFQYLSPTNPSQGRIVMTPTILDLQWNAIALYPAGYFSRDIKIAPSLKLPAGWKLATALSTRSMSRRGVSFQEVPFDTLIDSPVMAGRYYRKINLNPDGTSPVRLNIVADRPEFMVATPDQISRHRALIEQADKLFGARHFDHYDFLLALSKPLGRVGLEHHRSTEIVSRRGYFRDWNRLSAIHESVAHEYVHSWNGKFRRPADLWTANFNAPMRNSLLWMYEGQTQYWGMVLTARSGLIPKTVVLDNIAYTAAIYSAMAGRLWRPLADTVNDPIVASRRPIPWRSWQRSEDYYNEGKLIWLDADTLIRKRSNGARSLDDFAKAFFGQRDGSYAEMTYTFDDIVAALDHVEHYNWQQFLRDRIDKVTPKAPLDGLARGGYKLIFVDKPTDYWKSNEARRAIADLSFSLGIVVYKDATLQAVHWNSPAFRAGLTVGMKLLAVDGHAYSPNVLCNAVMRAEGSSKPITLLIKSDDRYRTIKVHYDDGLRYPHLERIGTAPALLDAILTPRR